MKSKRDLEESYKLLAINVMQNWKLLSNTILFIVISLNTHNGNASTLFLEPSLGYSYGASKQPMAIHDPFHYLGEGDMIRFDRSWRHHAVGISTKLSVQLYFITVGIDTRFYISRMNYQDADNTSYDNHYTNQTAKNILAGPYLGLIIPYFPLRLWFGYHYYNELKTKDRSADGLSTNWSLRGKAFLFGLGWLISRDKTWGISMNIEMLLHRYNQSKGGIDGSQAGSSQSLPYTTDIGEGKALTIGKLKGITYLFSLSIPFSVMPF